MQLEIIGDEINRTEPDGSSVWLWRNCDRRRKRRHQMEKTTETDTSRRPPSMDTALSAPDRFPPP